MSEPSFAESVEAEKESFETESVKFLSFDRAIWFGLGATALLALLVLHLSSAPRDFPLNNAIVIDQGLSAAEATNLLEANQVVKSETLLYLALIAWHDPEKVKAGTYVFSEPLSVWQVATRLTEAAPPGDLVALTLPEGFRASEYGRLAATALVDFNPDTFTALAESREGYLFPETYYVPPNFTEQELLELLLETYAEKIASLASSFVGSGLNEYEVLTLASIVEREANTPESMKLVAGILLDRLEIGMALQADASIEYVLQKPLSELTAGDLDIDSPYNTYLYPGLPPTPIGNPGLQSIEAVLNPTTSPYLFYITDSEGNFHYARTYQEHQANIDRYLR